MRPGHRSELLLNHRLEAHPPMQYVDWVIHNRKRLQIIDPTQMGPADPRSLNFDTIANAQHSFNVGFQKVTGKDPR